VVAAALAGYGAINLSALLAAIELGIQPMLFRDATGAPLYAPYPLRIAVPAMMIGHLTIAGLAEAAMSAGLFSYLRRNEPELLGLGHNPSQIQLPHPSQQQARMGHPRKLWGALAMVMLLTPLGILAGGAAWGEWAPKDFADPVRRAEISAASGRVAPPVAAPAGVERLAKLWTAPLPDYAPHFVKSAGFGYLLSAMFGVGLILVVAWLAQRLTQTARPGDAP
jgi:cobalt/nickel transport system permease protein